MALRSRKTKNTGKRRKKKASEMECCQRGRRGRCHSRASVPHGYPPPHCGKTWSLLGTVYSFFVLVSLIALIYMMLEYHCDTCSARSNISSVTKNIEDITVRMLYNLKIKIPYAY